MSMRGLFMGCWRCKFIEIVCDAGKYFSPPATAPSPAATIPHAFCTSPPTSRSSAQ